MSIRKMGRTWKTTFGNQFRFSYIHGMAWQSRSCCFMGLTPLSPSIGYFCMWKLSWSAKELGWKKKTSTLHCTSWCLMPAKSGSWHTVSPFPQRIYLHVCYILAAICQHRERTCIWSKANKVLAGGWHQHTRRCPGYKQGDQMMSSGIWYLQWSR